MELREKILDASVGLISEKGIAGLSMREVARRLNVTHQAPYHHFKDRSEILAAVAERGFDQLAATMRRAVEAEKDPVAKFEACGEAYVEFAVASPALFRVMLRPELTGKRHKAATAKASARAHAVLAEVVTGLRAAGYARKLDPEALTLTGWSVAHGLAALLIDSPLGGVSRTEAKALARTVGSTMGKLLSATR